MKEISDIVFYLPEYQENSNGIRLLWKAAFLFSKYADVKIVTFYAGGDFCEVKPEDRSLIKSINEISMTPDTIVVYSDMTNGNPLGCGRVVRYLMARPGLFNGGEFSHFYEDDFLLAYSNAISSDLTQLTLMDYESLLPLPTR